MYYLKRIAVKVAVDGPSAASDYRERGLMLRDDEMIGISDGEKGTTEFEGGVGR